MGSKPRPENPQTNRKAITSNPDRTSAENKPLEGTISRHNMYQIYVLGLVTFDLSEDPPEIGDESMQPVSWQELADFHEWLGQMLEKQWRDPGSLHVPTTYTAEPLFTVHEEPARPPGFGWSRLHPIHEETPRPPGFDWSRLTPFEYLYIPRRTDDE